MNLPKKSLLINNLEDIKYIDIPTYQRIPMIPAEGCVSKSSKYKIIIDGDGREFFLLPQGNRFIKMETSNSGIKRGMPVEEIPMEVDSYLYKKLKEKEMLYERKKAA